LVEVFGELENYYLLQDKLRRDFRGRVLMPVVQLAIAFLIIAGLIFILGLIAASRPGARPPALFGFRGPAGSVLFLIASLGSMGLVWVFGPALGRLALQRTGAGALWWRLPVIGPCWQAITMGRFALALSLTLDTGMSIMRALRLDLMATTNPLFEAQTERITEALKRGCTLLEALTLSGLFSGDFLSVVAVGEEGGRVPEMMRRQADYWYEEAARRLKSATRLASLLVWMIYAAFMVYAIFTIYTGAMAGG
jgi:type II secretory pathway component PulF